MQREVRDDMNFVGQRYYKVNQIFLRMTGLWPYQNSMYKHVCRVLTLLILVSSSITQFAKLQSSSRDLDRLLYNLTYAIPSLIYILKFLSYIIHGDEVRELLDRIQHDWNTLKDEKEREIIRYNTMIAMRYTIILFATSIFLAIGYISTLYLPGFFDLIRPLNESRSKKLPLLSEYFILDEQKHFYPLLTHQSTVILLGFIIVIATETLSMLYAHHACALFEVASYRLKHAFDNEIPSISDNNRYTIIYARIVRAVKLHKRAIEFLDYLRATFFLNYLTLLLLGVITITINLFRLFQSIATMDDWGELLASLCFVLGQYVYMFFVNYFGQKITDHSIEVFDTAYDTPWYTAPVQIQKVLLIILQRTVKGYALNISDIIVASLENFASLASVTLSYLTVIYAIR